MAAFVSALAFVQADPFNASHRNKLVKKKITTAHGPLIVRATAREDASATDGNSAGTVRREVLVGGAAGALSAAVSCHKAKAAPVPAPNLNICSASIGRAPGQALVDDVPLVFRNCCPPGLAPDKKRIDFTPDKGPLRIRKPLQKAVRDEEYLNKYHEAYRRMKELKPSDPRSMVQQANVHCAYCNDAYRPASPDISKLNKRLQIHFSWFFLPWHRFYLYFHEKILGSLINDPTFALPYWNWDNQFESDKANVIPDVFNSKVLWPAIYDENREQSRYTELVNLNMATIEQSGDPQANLNVMHQDVATVKGQEAFLGKPYRFGSDTPDFNLSQGSLERSPHTALHVWVGDSRNPLGEDMGNFYSAGRDPLFYLHHSNVDRLWEVWKTLDSKNVDFSETDYLETEFLFYDENQNLVKCKVKDAGDPISAFKYTFASAPDSQWINYQAPVANTLNLQATPQPLSGKTEVKNGEPLVIKVDLPQSLAGDREVTLVLQGVSVPMEEVRSLNVFLNLPQATASTTVNCAEFAGSWTNVPHLMAQGGDMQTTLDITFSIRENIARLKLSGSVTVSIVPVGRNKNATFTILGATSNIVD